MLDTVAEVWKLLSVTGILSEIWSWIDNENNRAVITWLGGGLAVLLAAAWAVFKFLRRSNKEPSSSTTATANYGIVAGGSISAGGNITIATGAVAERAIANADMLAITDKAMKAAEEKGKLSNQVEGLQQENKNLKAQLTAAVQRIEALAEVGDPKARAAIDQVRNTGDLAKLDEVLDAEFSRREDQIKQQAADWFDLCRESAAIAFLRGDIDKAQNRLETILRFFSNDIDATNRLGHIHDLRGRLSEAEQSYRRVLELAADNQSWQAVAYGNLGLILHTRGDLDDAEAMFRKALKIEIQLGSLEGMAIQYGNLGRIMQIRGDLNGAEAMFRKALKTFEKLGHLEGMASQSCNLGLILHATDDYDGAEAMFRQALELDKKSENLEGMASDYGNLGLVMQTRGDLDNAEAMLRKALELNEKLGRLEGMAIQYGNLGAVMHARDNFVGAEAMFHKALELDEKLGRGEGMATAYWNLGSIAAQHGDMPKAREFWTKSRDLNARLGAQHNVDELQGWLDNLSV